MSQHTFDGARRGAGSAAHTARSCAAREQAPRHSQRGEITADAVTRASARGAGHARIQVRSGHVPEQRDDARHAVRDAEVPREVRPLAQSGGNPAGIRPPRDDGIVSSSDGCSASCQIEPGWICAMPGKPCVGTCADGKIEGNEQCDDGNPVSGDGCSATCMVEDGWVCPTPGQPCIPQVR